MEYGNYSDHIQIGHAGDVLFLLDQVLSENNLAQDVVKVLEAIKAALERGII